MTVKNKFLYYKGEKVHCVDPTLEMSSPELNFRYNVCLSVFKDRERRRSFFIKTGSENVVLNITNWSKDIINLLNEDSLIRTENQIYLRIPIGPEYDIYHNLIGFIINYNIIMKYRQYMDHPYRVYREKSFIGMYKTFNEAKQKYEEPPFRIVYNY